MESETAVMLTRLQDLDPVVSTGKIAYWLCASAGIRQGIRNLALQYLIDTGQQDWIRKSLPHFVEADTLRLAFLSKLPDALVEMEGVRELVCWGGRQMLEKFPIEVTQMKGLETLSLPANGISRLPEGLCRMQSLRFLDLSYNPLEVLPDCLADMPALAHLIITRPMLREKAASQLETLAISSPELTIESVAS